MDNEHGLLYRKKLLEERTNQQQTPGEVGPSSQADFSHRLGRLTVGALDRAASDAFPGSDLNLGQKRVALLDRELGKSNWDMREVERPDAPGHNSVPLPVQTTRYAQQGLPETYLGTTPLSEADEPQYDIHVKEMPAGQQAPVPEQPELPQASQDPRNF